MELEKLGRIRTREFFVGSEDFTHYAISVFNHRSLI